MDSDQTTTLPELSVTYVMQGLTWSLLAFLAICCVGLPIGITYWTSMGLRKIASAMMTSSSGFNAGGLSFVPIQNMRFERWE